MAAPRDASGAEGEVPAFESLPVEGETYNCTLGAEASVAVAEATMTWHHCRQKSIDAIVQSLESSNQSLTSPFSHQIV